MKQIIINWQNFIDFADTELTFRKVLSSKEKEVLKELGAKYAHGIVKINPRRLSNVEKVGNEVILTV